MVAMRSLAVVLAGFALTPLAVGVTRIRSLHERTRWTVLSGTGRYAGLHGYGTCAGRLIVNEVSFRDRCSGLVSR